VSGLLVVQVVVAVVIVGALAAYWLFVIRNQARNEHARLKEHARTIRAHYAAVEAAEDNPAFSPDAIREFVTLVVALANNLWRTEDSSGLAGRPDATLVRAWARARQSWLGLDLEIKRRPSIDLLRIVNRENEEEDRVIVRVRLWVHRKHPTFELTVRLVHLDERWTLGRSNGHWVLLSVDGNPLAGPVLTAPLVPTPAYDTERLREESLADLASGTKVADDVVLSDLVSEDQPPALALMDLSVLEGRFMPAVVAGSLAHLIEAWEEATTGSEKPFKVLAGAEARAALLQPGPGARMVICDAVLQSWEPTRLEISQRPYAIEVTLHVDAVRYVVSGSGEHLAGSDRESHKMLLKWTLQLTDSSRVPWKLVVSSSPADAIPGWG